MNTPYHIISGNNQQHFCTNAIGPKKKPKVKWSIQLEAKSAPMVHEGHLYISADEEFYAIDLETGKTLWTMELPGEATPPTIVNDVLYFGGKHIDNHLYAVDKNTGEELYKYRTGTSNAGVLKYPVVEEDKLIFAAGKTVHALLPDSKKPVWKYKMSERASHFPVTVGDGLVFVTTHNHLHKGKLFGVDLLDGKEVVKLSLNLAITSNMLFSNGNLYFTDMEDKLNILNVATGDIQSFPVVEGRKFYSSFLALKGENMLIAIGAMIASLNLSNWQWSWVYHAKGSIGQPVIADDMVYFATCFDGIYGLDFQTGKVNFRIKTDVRSTYSCAIDEGKLYMAGSMNEHELIAFQ